MITRKNFNVRRNTVDYRGRQLISVSFQLESTWRIDSNDPCAPSAKEIEDRLIAESLKEVYGDVELAVHKLRRTVLSSIGMNPTTYDAFEKVLGMFHE